MGVRRLQTNGHQAQRVIAARNAGGPRALLMVSTRGQVVSVKPVETRSRKTKATGGNWGLEFLGPERSQHVTNQWRGTAMGQLPFLNFSSAERNRTGGRSPPDPLGYFALELETAGASWASEMPSPRTHRHASRFADLSVTRVGRPSSNFTP